jgi:hypothetical protein
MTPIRLLPPAIALCALLALTSCGGGGGGSVAGGIGGTGSALGSVSAKGSVTVNGVKFETNDARVFVDGVEQPRGDLSQIQLGMTVLVRGRYDSASAGVATEVNYLSNQRGPIASINPVNNSFEAMGRTILVDPDPNVGTRFATPLTGLADLQVNDLVEVSGSPNASGSLVASFIERKGTFVNGTTDIQIKGDVTSLDVNATTFKIGPLVVDYDATGGTVFKNMTPGDLAAGPSVEVKGKTFDQQGRFIAASIERISRAFVLNANDRLEIQGLVRDCAAPCTAFSIEGQRVATNAQTQFKNGSLDDVLNDRKLEVEGKVDATGVLVATQVAFVKGSADVEAGADAPADVANQTFSILGISVKVNSVTEFESGLDLSSINTTALRVRGYRIGDKAILAKRIERRSSGSGDVRLKGPLQSTAPGTSSFTILGVPIAVDNSTRFTNESSGAVTPITFAAFFGTTPSGAIVKVKGREQPDNQIDASGANGEVDIESLP